MRLTSANSLSFQPKYGIIYIVKGKSTRGMGSSEQSVQARRVLAHRKEGGAGTRPGSRFVSGKRPFRPRKSPLQSAGGLSGLGKGPCILQEGFPALKNTPAFCEGAFQPSKTSVQSARRFFNLQKRPCNLHGRFLRPYRLQTPLPDSTSGAENGKIPVKLRKDVAE